MTLLVKNLTHRYGRFLALDNFNASFQGGKITALLGPNGAGKSTLFKLISGLITTQAGEFELNTDSWKSPSPLILKKMGFVFQEPALDTMRTGHANLKYAAGLHRLDKKTAHKQIIEVTTLLKCNDFIDRPIRTLSGGERRRIEVARALIHKPEWILLDEPTVGLDIDSRNQLSEDLHALSKNQHIGIVWCTHITDELRPDDNLIIITGGQNKFTGECGDQDQLMQTYRKVVDGNV